MGFITNEGGKNRVYVNFNAKTGAIQVSRKEGENWVRTDVRGIENLLVTKVEMREDTYEGQPVTKLVVHGVMDKGTEDEMGVVFTSNMGAWATGRFLSLLCESDLLRPITVVARTQYKGSQYKRKDGSMSDPLERDLHSIEVVQDGRYVRTNDLPPKANLVRMGQGRYAREVVDNSARLEWAEIKLKEISAKLGRSAEAAGHDPVAHADDFNDAPIDYDDIPF